MDKIKNLFKTIYSIEAINEFLHTNILKSLFVYLFYCMILNFSLAIGFINMNTINPSIISKNIYNEITKDVLNQFPDCKIINSSLTCRNNDSYSKQFSDFILVINSEEKPDNNETNIIFNRDEVKVINKITELQLDYTYFDNFSFNDFSTPDSFINDISSRLFLSIKPYILFPALLTIYGITIFGNLIYVFILSLVGLLLNLGSKKNMPYKQLFNLIIYSSLLPTMISLLVSILFSPIFGVVIYNFTLGFYFIYNYKKLIKGNFSQIELSNNKYI